MWLVFVLACRAWVTFCGITFREFFCAGFVTVAGVIVAVLDSTLIKVGVLPLFFVDIIGFAGNFVVAFAVMTLRFW